MPSIKPSLVEGTSLVIRRYMLRNGYNQTDLGKAIGINQATVSLRLKCGGWRQSELAALVKLFHMKEVDALKLLGY